MELASQSCNTFAALHIPLPEFLTSIAVSILKCVIDTDPAQHTLHQSQFNYQYLEAQYFNQ